jgi:hypothetical protein
MQQLLMLNQEEIFTNVPEILNFIDNECQRLKKTIHGLVQNVMSLIKD